MSKVLVRQLGDGDHPATLKDIMTAPPTTPQELARIHKVRINNRRKVEDKILERALCGQDVL